MRVLLVPMDSADVLICAAREVEYVAAKHSTAEVELWNGVRAVREDHKELRAQYDETLSALCASLSPYLADRLAHDELLLHVPSNFDVGQEGVLRSLCAEYCVNMVVSLWLSLYGLSDMAAVYDGRATAQLSLIVATLNKRVRPLQPLYDDEHNVIARRHVVER